MSVNLVNGIIFGKLSVSYLVDVPLEKFDSTTATKMIAEGKCEQTNMEFLGVDTGRPIEITSFVPFNLKSLKSFSSSARHLLKEEKIRTKEEREKMKLEADARESKKTMDERNKNTKKHGRK